MATAQCGLFNATQAGGDSDIVGARRRRGGRRRRHSCEDGTDEGGGGGGAEMRKPKDLKADRRRVRRVRTATSPPPYAGTRRATSDLVPRAALGWSDDVAPGTRRGSADPEQVNCAARAPPARSPAASHELSRSNGHAGAPCNDTIGVGMTHLLHGAAAQLVNPIPALFHACTRAFPSLRRGMRLSTALMRHQRHRRCMFGSHGRPRHGSCHYGSSGFHTFLLLGAGGSSQHRGSVGAIEASTASSTAFIILSIRSFEAHFLFSFLSLRPSHLHASALRHSFIPFTFFLRRVSLSQLGLPPLLSRHSSSHISSHCSHPQ